MCYNIQVLEKRAEKMSKRYNAQFPQGDLFKHVYHVSAFLHPHWPVVTQRAERTINFYTWGLIPHWAKTKEDAAKISLMTPNCVAVTAFQKPSFRNAIARNRCLVPVTGFFEWHTIGKKKFPFYIFLKSKEVFSLAGIYDHWTDKETGEIISSFSILTTVANPLLSKIHNSKKRMPLILPLEKELDWIKPNLSKEEVTSFMKPFDESLMEAYSITKRITSRTENNNVPEVMEQFQYSELVAEGL